MTKTIDVYVACSQEIKHYVEGYFCGLEDQKYDFRGRLHVRFEKLGSHRRKDIANVIGASNGFLREANDAYFDFLQMILDTVPPQQSGKIISLYKGVEQEEDCHGLMKDYYIEALRKRLFGTGSVFVSMISEVERW